METVTAYCVKCKCKQTMLDPKAAKAKNGRNMKQGQCGKCGTKLTVFVAGK